MSHLLPSWLSSIQFLDVCLHIDPFQTPLVHNWVQTDPDIRMGDGFAAASADSLSQVIRVGISSPLLTCPA